ncbi:MAG: GGDEF domain-containing protein [Aliihoeflea sp.]
MKLYALMNRLRWPSSYVGKIFLLCFIGTHVPLIALVFWAITSAGVAVPASVLMVVLLATLAGTAFTVAALASMLAPLKLSSSALRAYAAEKEKPALPVAFQDDAGQLMASVQRTIEKLDDKMSELSNLSQSDELTGAKNRRWMNEVGIPQFERARRNGKSYALMVIDLDEFKQINDIWGHSIGDQVLLVVCDAIRMAIREEDSVVRTGGDEFCVFLPKIGRQQAHDVAERVCREAAGAAKMLPIEHSVTISIGVAVAQQSDRGFTDVYRRADRHLYLVKESGRGRVVSAEPGSNREAR